MSAISTRRPPAKFTDDLTSGVPPATITLGRVGYAAKGVALGIVGALFGWAALTHDSNRAGGLDPALRMLRDQPYGRVLLALTALGIASFGIYCSSGPAMPNTDHDGGEPGLWARPGPSAQPGGPDEEGAVPAETSLPRASSYFSIMSR